MKTMMARFLITLSIFCATLAHAQVVVNTITDTRVTPAQRQLVATQDNTLMITWQVITNPASTTVVSGQAVVLNPVNGNVLGPALAGQITAGPSSPHVFNETLTITAAQVQGWINQGLQRVVLARDFTDQTSSNSAVESITLRLNTGTLAGTRSNPTADLVINKLRLEYESGNNLAVVNQNDELSALLSVYYTGTGLLEGRWQIADPTSSSGNPVFRTLALVRKQLASNQRTEIPSPALPTTRSGKYLVRFCVTNRELIEDASTTAGQCPIDTLIVDAAYQVDGAEAAATQQIGGLSPNQQPVDANSSFSWQALPAAKIYQLQIFSLAPRAENSTGNNPDTEVVEPEFVTGMILRGSTHNALLSELVRSKLKPDHRYLWRITAHDSAGQLIGSSDEATFIYRGQ